MDTNSSIMQMSGVEHTVGQKELEKHVRSNKEIDTLV